MLYGGVVVHIIVIALYAHRIRSKNKKAHRCDIARRGVTMSDATCVKSERYDEKVKFTIYRSV